MDGNEQFLNFLDGLMKTLNNNANILGKAGRMEEKFSLLGYP